MTVVGGEGPGRETAVAEGAAGGAAGAAGAVFSADFFSVLFSSSCILIFDLPDIFKILPFVSGLDVSWSWKSLVL